MHEDNIERPFQPVFQSNCVLTEVRCDQLQIPVPPAMKVRVGKGRCAAGVRPEAERKQHSGPQTPPG